MPLQNRVDPFGEIHAVAARGTLLGNRDGRFHAADRMLGPRRHASRQWISCELSFRGRRRVPMTQGYTELFFADEPTALAAGHRPCFECRRREATAFATAFAIGQDRSNRLAVDAMDRIIDAERRVGRMKRLHTAEVMTLPQGAMVVHDQRAHLLWEEELHPWSFSGYGRPVPRGTGEIVVLTPPSILAALSVGFVPRPPLFTSPSTA
jgi:hypothetical protein